jgi:hypothetical protein
MGSYALGLARGAARRGTHDRRVNWSALWDFRTGSLADVIGGVRPTVTRASTAWAFNAAGVLTAYPADVLRIVPSPAGVMSALREPQSTNLFLYSAELTNGYWTGGKSAGVDITASGTVAPTGAGTLFTVTRNAALVHTFVRQSFGAPLVVDAWKTTSCLARKNTHRYIGLRAAGAGGGVHATFDFDTGTWSATNGYAVTATLLPSGLWWLAAARLVTVAETAGGGYAAGICMPDAAGNESPAAAAVPVGAAVDLWGMQHEALAFATSPILTAGAQVTRARDEINIPISVQAGEAYSEFIDFVMPAKAATYSTIIGNAGKSRTTVLLDTLVGEFRNGGVSLIPANAYALNTRGKLAYAGDAAGRSGAMNGGAVKSDANTHGAAINVLLGQDTAGGDLRAPQLYIHSFGTLRSRLSDAQLQALTAA